MHLFSLVTVALGFLFVVKRFWVASELNVVGMVLASGVDRQSLIYHYDGL